MSVSYLRYKTALRLILAALLVLGLGLPASRILAETCVPFCPARQDIPGLLEPIIVLSGDMDEEGTLDLAVISQQIPGDLTKGSVSIFGGKLNGDFVPIGSDVVTGSPTAAALADFDGDDHLDVVVAHFLDESLTLLRGDGSGAFPVIETISLPAEPTALAASIFDGNATQDLLIVTAPTGISGILRVYSGAGDGTFSELTTAVVASDPRDVAVDDFDKDGNRDVAVGHRNSQRVTIFLGTGGGYLGPPSEILLGASVNELEVSDINNDGKLDLIAGGDTVASSVVPLLGDGAGGFTPQPGIPLQSGVPSVTACDYDRDDNVDLIAARFTGDSLSLLRGRGDGTFDPPEDLGVNSRPRSLTSSDFNKDGFCDSISGNQAAGTVSVYLADGLGNLGTPRFGVGTTPLGVAAADLNGDGRPDLISANRDSGDVSVLFGDGDGGFTLVQTLAAGLNPGASIIADLSGDGALDIAVLNQGNPSSPQNSEVNLYFGNGFGSFPFQDTLNTGKLPLDLIPTDFSGDGIEDLVVSNSESGTVAVYKSKGGGSFENGRSTSMGGVPGYLAALDYSGDGLMDIAVGMRDLNEIRFMRQLSTGAFNKAGLTLPGAGTIIDDLEAGDINGDGRDDLLWINQTSINEPSTISIYLSDGAGGFVEAPSSGLLTTTFAEALILIDLDRMGGIDLAVTNRFNDSVVVYVGDNAGGFTDLGDFGSGREPFALAVADFNRDGRDDLATADFSGDSISVMLNNTFIDPGFTTVQPASHTTWIWDPIPGATSYNVYRGLTSILRDKDYGTCLQAGVTGGFMDTDLPSAGQAFFYVVTPRYNGDEGQMGLTTGCLKRVNRHPCPL